MGLRPKPHASLAGAPWPRSAPRGALCAPVAVVDRLLPVVRCDGGSPPPVMRRGGSRCRRCPNSDGASPQTPRVARGGPMAPLRSAGRAVRARRSCGSTAPRCSVRRGLTTTGHAQGWKPVQTMSKFRWGVAPNPTRRSRGPHGPAPLRGARFARRSQLWSDCSPLSGAKGVHDNWSCAGWKPVHTISRRVMRPSLTRQ